MKRQDKYKDTSTFKFFNANPKDRLANDCVVRAISTATNKSWDEVFDDLCKIAIKLKLMPNDDKCYARYLDDLGWDKCRQPRKLEDNTKYTGKEFCSKLNRAYKNGYKDSSAVIAHIGGHHIVCIKWDSAEDGVAFDKYGFRVHDTWDSTEGCIGNYWIKREG